MTESPDTLASKLAAAGYQAPTVRPVCRTVNCGVAVTPGVIYCQDCIAEIDSMQRYLRARDCYLSELSRHRSLPERAAILLATVWHWFAREGWRRISHCAIGMGIVLITALVLIVSCVASARGAEVPCWVLRGIAQVETGTVYHGVGDVRGTWSRGAIGEASPWQLSPAVLRDLRAYDRRHRVHADVVLAESLTRAWLLRLHRATGSWDSAVAAYHAGLGRRSHAFALDYAQRVRAVGVLP